VRTAETHKPIDMPFESETTHLMGCKLAPPCEYDEMIGAMRAIAAISIATCFMNAQRGRLQRQSDAEPGDGDTRGRRVLASASSSD